MTLSKTHILAALIAATALSGCLSSGGGVTTPSSAGGGTGGGSTGGGSTGGGSTGGGSTGGGSTGGGSTGGGSTGGGSTGGITVAEFDTELARISAMSNSPSLPNAMTARYEGAVKMTGADFSSGLRTYEILGDLALDLDYTTGGGVGNMTSVTSVADVWTGGVSNLRGTVTTAGIGGSTTDDLNISGHLDVQPQGSGYNNSVVYSYPLARMNAFMDASGMVLEGKNVSGVVGLVGTFKGDNQEYIDMSNGINAPLTIDDGGGASHQVNLLGGGYAEKQ
ncbi:hypothetical protein [Thalassospira alkalitolerans]|uniref:hypothetical protein n=1 Tax=Thalassospira alkalitolerans TaxID=1293890 RepID=UPI003AA9A75A